MSEVVVTSKQNLQNEVRYGAGQTLITDEPSEIGGDGAGPDPYSLILGALGSCISITVTLYARRKQWPLEQVTVRLRQNRIHGRRSQYIDRVGSSSQPFTRSKLGPGSQTS